MFEDRGCEGLMNKCSAYKKVVSIIANSCVRQQVVVIAVAVKCEQWHRTQICFYLVYNQRTHI